MKITARRLFKPIIKDLKKRFTKKKSDFDCFSRFESRL